LRSRFVREDLENLIEPGDLEDAAHARAQTEDGKLPAVAFNPLEVSMKTARPALSM
jgi:hypothetical protein